MRGDARKRLNGGASNFPPPEEDAGGGKVHPKFEAFKNRVLENAEARDAYIAARERAAAEDAGERIAVAIEDAALHVMATVASNEGAALTAAILERAATIAREVTRNA